MLPGEELRNTNLSCLDVVILAPEHSVHSVRIDILGWSVETMANRAKIQITKTQATIPLSMSWSGMFGQRFPKCGSHSSDPEAELPPTVWAQGAMPLAVAQGQPVLPKAKAKAKAKGVAKAKPAAKTQGKAEAKAKAKAKSKARARPTAHALGVPQQGWLGKHSTTR